ncbi:aspartate carbamoyltransferase regulatory subunit [Methanosarcina thermophila]|jgi:aspartate carbamoyltransferase regulatory subunit|uniref:Aspartate carbamoyltransferase regulatory chain n=3 Tax=Methanosarcina thermophila TaxID=2210 RepID=A0A0E3L128_METTE|nr:aspartate carbamoyltransferase regulatory subunit [Methanosarcina thermophila]AKB13424.1 Aspartate carbamoyltransferase regulatory chain (PyrI) [Methanosarcina thermophila TM-1]AKB15941.1 Aspartate carbamoyltransferase regulatory chain (PyrI) [Methanosarcina thermophila CHTI-55]NLU57437.1 aspartate carbamoyltransferase regulatory subunit [Methanosarcina thermophila]SFT32612.1 aspartate carbamoyltransferase regulatory subunit [Methanosarcina thermophila]GLI12892.1 aspartate carbamoyltransfer
MKGKRNLKVEAIEKGTVIDHIRAGQALNVLRILGISSDFRATISFVMNAIGARGKKDVVKIEGKELSVEELNKIALISPTATINIIRDFEVVQKNNVVLPPSVEGVVRCTNSKCISNSNEPIKSKFSVQQSEEEGVTLRCLYCEHVISENIAENLL